MLDWLRDVHKFQDESRIAMAPSELSATWTSSTCELRKAVHGGVSALLSNIHVHDYSPNMV